MRRAVSAAPENESTGMLGVAPVSMPGEWFSANGGSPGSVVTTADDEFGLEMQQLITSLPLSTDELNWNA
jgi:hypothetical protein